VIAYLDTSALLRLVLCEPGAFEDLRSSEALVSSALFAVESLRRIDHGALLPEEAASRRATVAEWLEVWFFVAVSPPRSAAFARLGHEMSCSSEHPEAASRVLREPRRRPERLAAANGA